MTTFKDFFLPAGMTGNGGDREVGNVRVGEDVWILDQVSQVP